MSKLRTFAERIERLHEEKRKALPFADELERLLLERGPVVASRPAGPLFGKPNPDNAKAEPSTLVWRAHGLLGEVAKLVRAANMLCAEAYEGRRSFMLACRILGLPWSHIEKAVSDVRLHGLDVASRAWATYLGPTDQRIVGKVYVAATASRPDIIKIGFSKNPEKRAKSLSRQHGVAIDVIHDEGGTMLHEWAIHQLLFRSSVAPEWYSASKVPAWLFPVEFGGAA